MKNKNKKGLSLPVDAKINDVIDLTPDVKLYKLRKPQSFFYSPGQFVMASIWGAGEVPISITSTSEIHQDIELCIRKAGFVTSALHRLKPGDSIGIRGPLGNRFPFEDAYGKDVLFIAGGIGIAPLRSLINLVIEKRKNFGKIALIYGSKTPTEVLFMPETQNWKENGIDLTLTIDVECKEWECSFGLVTEHINRQSISFESGYAFICGPHVMINAAMHDLSLLGMPAENIITTIEAHMKCGVGKCGHCYSDGRYVCTDGPVFSYAEIREFGMASP